MLRRVVSAALLALLVLSLSGCYETDVTARIDHDSETISGTVLVGAQDKYAKGVLGTTDPKKVIEGAHIEAMVASLLPQGTKVTPWTGDGVVGAKITFTDQPLDKMPLDLTPIGVTIDVAHEGGKYVLDATLDPRSVGIDSYLLEDSRASFAITFPGDIDATNGQADGSTVTWEHSGPDPLHMTASSGEKPSLVSAAKRNLWAPTLGLAAVGLLGFAGYALRRDMQRKRAALPKAAGKKGRRGDTDAHVPPPKMANSAQRSTRTTKPKGA